MSEAVASPAAGAQTSGQIFSRESSGLVRIGSPWRMLLLNVANVGIVYIMFTYWTFPAVFPQSNLLVAIPIAAALALPFNLLYGMFATIMPGPEANMSSCRGRSIPPSASWPASRRDEPGLLGRDRWLLDRPFVLGPLFSSYGLASGNKTIADIGAWANEPTTWFLFGTVFIVLMAALTSVACAPTSGSRTSTG